MKIFQIRPHSLLEFQGKTEIKKNLEVYIKSCLSRNETLDHCLLYGPAGVGKTSLAHIIANELKQKIKIVQGPELQEKADILNLLYSLGENNVIFIDEIHAINPKCFEILYSAMEDFKINIEIGKEFNKKLTSVHVPRFTLIGATTKLGNLPNPFEERFGIVINISEYTPNEIQQILFYTLKEMNFTSIDNKIIKKISETSKGIPRIAKRNLSRILDHIQFGNKDIDQIFCNIGIYENGLQEIDIKYLIHLKNNKKIGLKTICQLLNIDEKTLLNKIEPYLIKNGYVNKTTNGRCITIQGEKLLNNLNFKN